MAETKAFDVVVVGGGAAGCVVAARLAESASHAVMLVEAGPDLRANLPGEFRDGWRLPSGFDWGYLSEPDARGVAADLRRGKLVGGTSWLTRFAVRGSPADYDEWAGLGNAGWGFTDVLPYFRQLEADAEFGDRPWHGDAGPIPVSRYPALDLTEAGAAGLTALEAAGFPLIEDHNRPGAVGAARMPMSSRDGIRVTSADAYLPTGGTPPNLTIRPGAHVAGVVFEGTRATGVRLLGGPVIEAGWVVLCAGAYGSPAVLMRSGIGPATHLRAHGIPVRADLPGVGANLADHAGVDIDCGYRGPARTAPILHLLATFHSSATPDTQAPDLMLWLSDPRGDPPVFEIDAGLLRPRCRGTVRLRSADPAEPPSIQLPGLRDSSDIERLAEAYQRGLEVAGHKQIRRLCARPPTPQARGAADLADLIRVHGYSFPHVVGTCAMGPRPGDGAVVDTSGRVHGTDRLTIADASIVPNATSAFTHIPAMMLAERLSEHIASAI
jgi:choline dehydrogenase